MAGRKAAAKPSAPSGQLRPRSLLSKPKRSNPYRFVALRIAAKRLLRLVAVVVPGAAAFATCVLLAVRGELGARSSLWAAVAVWVVLVWRTVARLWGLGGNGPLSELV